MFKGHKNREKMAKNPTSFKIMDEKRNCHEETIVLNILIMTILKDPFNTHIHR